MSSKRKHKYTTLARRQRRVAIAGAGALAATALVALASLASAGQEKAADSGSGSSGKDTDTGAVFVQANELDGNTIRSFERAADGKLTAAGSYETGGLGGNQTGAPTDSLASQGSLVLDRRSELLLAVNAGSNTVTSFHVDGQKLSDPKVVASGGDFPSSIAVSGDTAYVLNAGGTGTVQGFRIDKDGLEPLEDSSRSLGLDNEAVPAFDTSPGQVAFTPDRRNLLVTTKAANTIEVFPLNDQGTPATDAPVSTRTAGDVPFAITFDRADRVLVAEAAKSTVTTYQVRQDGTLKVVQEPLANGQEVLCWLERAGDFFYGGNTGNSTVSGYAQDKDGKLALTEASGVATPPSPDSQGVIDLAVTPDNNFLYVQNAISGTVDAFRIGADGALTKVSTTDGLPKFEVSGMEGIVAD
jgi:6-phosphogluconolactonase (cycloisomerase 2 family)